MKNGLIQMKFLNAVASSVFDGVNFKFAREKSVWVKVIHKLKCFKNIRCGLIGNTKVNGI